MLLTKKRQNGLIKKTKSLVYKEFNMHVTMDTQHLHLPPQAPMHEAAKLIQTMKLKIVLNQQMMN